MTQNFDESNKIEEYIEFYRKYLYELLPITYRERDTDETLKEFLEIIGEQAAVIRQNIDDLWKNFYTDSSESWAIPYIGELLDTKSTSNFSISNRTDLKKTIQWRKLKGTLSGIESLARNYVGGGIRTKEFFEICSRLPHINHLKENSLKPNFVKIRDQIPLLELGTIHDEIPHTIDIRNPSNSNGWYHPKNIGLFLSLLHVYHRQDVESMKDSDFRYYFNAIQKDNKSQKSPLFNGISRMKINSKKFERNPLSYFGKNNYFTIKINNIPAAVSELGSPEPVKLKENPEIDLITISNSEINKNTDFVGMDPKDGMRLLDARKFSNPERQFLITALFQTDDGNINEIAHLDTSNLPDNRFNLLPQSDYSGKLLLKIELKPNCLPGEFPETVISIRDSRFPFVNHKNSQKNSIESKYQNALYVYLPKLALPTITGENSVYLFVDNDGTTYFVKYLDNKFVIDDKIPQRSMGQIYPPRMLNFSLDPLDRFGQLSRLHGLQAVDPTKFQDEFIIEALCENIGENVTWKLGQLHIKPDSIKYQNANEVWVRWNIPNTSFENQNFSMPSIEWASHFKSIRHDGIIESQIEQPIFQDYLMGTDEDKKEKILDIVKKALGYFIDDVHSLECTINEKLDDQRNCIEFNVNIEFKPLSHKEFSEKSKITQDAINQNPLFINNGDLILKVKSITQENFFPLSIIQIANKNNLSTLVYLPQIKLIPNLPKYFRVGTDGSTFYNQIHPKNLARKSAGQIIPIPARFPLQQRMPRYMDLSDWNSVSKKSVLRGEIGIDPQNGRFVFAESDGDTKNISTSFYSGFPHVLGSTTIDRTAHVTEWEREAKIPLTYGSTTTFPDNYKWITKEGVDGGTNLLPSIIFKNIEEAFSKLRDHDVLEIIDNAIYDLPPKLIIPSNVNDLTIQTTTQQVSKIQFDKNETEELVIEGDLDTLKIYGLTFIGKKLKIKGNVKNLVLCYCTFIPHSKSDGINIEFESNDSHDRKIFISKTIMQGISLDETPTKIIVHDSIIENFSGAAIQTKSNSDDISTITLEAERTDILSHKENITLFKELRISDCIFTGKISVIDGDDSWLRFSRYEPGSIFPKIMIGDKQKQITYKCTSETPLFVSKEFGNIHYLYLHRLCSKKIINGGEDSLSMGVYNRAYRFKLVENLDAQLEEYLPFGTRKSLIYTS